MIAPIALLLKWYRRAGRWLDKHALPAWLDDFSGLVVQFVATAWSWFFTAFYSIFYARHFYSRIGVKLSRRVTAESSDPYPYLFRPLSYLAAFFGLLVAFRFLRVPWLSQLPDWPDWQYDGLLLVATILLPLAAVLATLALVVTSFILFSILRVIASLTGRKKHALKRVPINFAFFALIGGRRFWQGYRYDELPVLLYCSINGIILWPLAYTFLVRVADGVGAVMNSDLLWGETHGAFGWGWQLIGGALFSYSFLLILYALVLRPVLYAFVFRSRLPLLRGGTFPELLAFDRPIDPEATVVFLDTNLAETSEDEAKFVWVRRKFGPRRVFNRLIAAPRIAVPRSADGVAATVQRR